MLTYADVAWIRRLKTLSSREPAVGKVEDGGGQDALASKALEAEMEEEREREREVLKALVARQLYADVCGRMRTYADVC